MKLIIHAPNVHEGGGRTLLIALLRALEGRDNALAIVDARLSLPPELSGVHIALRVTPTIACRLAAEWRLRKLSTPETVVLCLGNLPPLLGARGHLSLFIQNRFLLESDELSDFPLRVRLRMFLERMWLRSLAPLAHTIVVQTPTMKRAIKERFGREALIAPFSDSLGQYPRRASRGSRSEQTEFDFLYVASGEPHKNHVNLLAAWQQLANEGLHPSLCLTIARDRYPDLYARVESARVTLGLNIHNFEASTPDVVMALYRRSSALIYPSLVESLGLPLIEARSEGLPVIAAELDYVRDVLDPEETFDPESPISIGRAVKRFLSVDELPLPVMSAEEFVNQLLSGFMKFNVGS